MQAQLRIVGRQPLRLLAEQPELELAAVLEHALVELLVLVALLDDLLVGGGELLDLLAQGSDLVGDGVVHRHAS